MDVDILISYSPPYSDSVHERDRDGDNARVMSDMFGQLSTIYFRGRGRGQADTEFCVALNNICLSVILVEIINVYRTRLQVIPFLGRQRTLSQEWGAVTSSVSE